MQSRWEFCSYVALHDAGWLDDEPLRELPTRRGLSLLSIAALFAMVTARPQLLRIRLAAFLE